MFCYDIDAEKKQWMPTPKQREDETVTVLPDKHLRTLYATLSEHSHKWRDIGIHLGFHTSKLENIQAKPLLLSGAPNTYLQEMLTEWLQWAPGDGRGSENCATLGGLRDALNKAGLPETAQSIMTLDLST